MDQCAKILYLSDASKHHILVHNLSKSLFLVDNYPCKLFAPMYTSVRIGVSGVLAALRIVDTVRIFPGSHRKLWALVQKIPYKLGSVRGNKWVAVSS